MNWDNLKVGDKITIKGAFAEIKYIGPYHLKSGTFVGVALELPKGKNNGTIHGHEYFKCEDSHGLFVDIDTLKKVAVIQDQTSNNKTIQSPVKESKSEIKSIITPQPTKGERQITYSDQEIKSEMDKYAEIKGQIKAIQQSSRILERQIKEENEKDPQIRFIQMQIENEKYLYEQEIQISQVYAEIRRYIQTADKKTLNSRINLLKSLNQEHSLFENDSLGVLQLQCSNLYTVRKSIALLKKQIISKKIKKDTLTKELLEKKKELSFKETELAKKRPEWKTVSSLRERATKNESELSTLTLDGNLLSSISKSMELFFSSNNTLSKNQIFQACLCIDKAESLLLLKISNLEKLNDSQKILAESERAMHDCMIARLVFSGHIIQSSPISDLIVELKSMKNLSVIEALLKKIADFDIEKVLTPHYLKYIAYSLSSDSMKQHLLQCAQKFPPIIFSHDESYDILITEVKKDFNSVLNGAKVNFDSYINNVVSFIPEFKEYSSIFEDPNADKRKARKNKFRSMISEMQKELDSI